MRRHSFLAGAMALAGSLVAGQEQPQLDPWTLVGWNDLGMHCMDGDFSLFALLPPYNTIHAELLDAQGRRVTDPAAATVRYEAVADVTGSINRTSIGKTNFWFHVSDLFGASPPPDEGLAGYAMPGAGNQPQAMAWDGALEWHSAEGIPITPYDDAHAANQYPMMRLVARDTNGVLLASTRIVLPVSEEMECTACHASGTNPAAQPAAGWAWDPVPQLDFRKNVLRLHDESEAGNPLFVAALAALGYDPAGLWTTAVVDGRAILCASCHSSNALPGSGYPGILALTRAVHAGHALVVDPDSGLPLDSSLLRGACYRCHPGAETRCLRGAMGKAVAPSGELSMQCQSCHGTMSRVGSSERTGWLEEPACQSCHTGTATHNNGQIRYTSVFDEFGNEREAVDATFATTPGVPAPGFDLYRFSRGHGGLSCSSCHGSPHAVFPTSEANDNVQNIALQGHEGTFVECESCHRTTLAPSLDGPHGMHPIGDSWVDGHGDLASNFGTWACLACHGAAADGTVLSYSQSVWTASTPWGPRPMWRGFRIGCWACHLGPEDEDGNPNHPGDAMDGTASTGLLPQRVTLVAADPDGDPLTLRVVTQPRHATVGWVGSVAMVYPEPGYEGPDQFEFAAWDGEIDSDLGTVLLSIQAAYGLFADGFETSDARRWSSTLP